MSGYVRIHRPLFEEHPAFRNHAEAMAFAWLIVKAQWKPKRVRYKERIIFLDRGQVAVSLRDMANHLDRDKAWVQRLLKRLESEAMIVTRHETGVNVVTICNYNEYQADIKTPETADETPRDTGARQGRYTEQEREEREEGKNSASQSVRAAKVEALSFWNTNAIEAGWRKVVKLSAARDAALGARLRDHGLDGWKAAIIRARASPFLGRDPPPWFNFDFLISETKFLKLIEGNYDRRNNDSADPTLVALASFRDPGACGRAGEMPQAGSSGWDGR